MKIRYLLIIGLISITFNASAVCLGVGCTCEAAAGDLDFGEYNFFDGVNVDSVATVSVTCSALLGTATISYEVHLNQGNSGQYNPRAMNNGQMDLEYNLYTDSARTIIWGDGSGGTQIQTLNYALVLTNSRTDPFTVYGRIPANQNVSAGTYTDLIVATVVF